MYITLAPLVLVPFSYYALVPVVLRWYLATYIRGKHGQIKPWLCSVLY